jgi:hypothetical protein
VRFIGSLNDETKAIGMQVDQQNSIELPTPLRTRTRPGSAVAPSSVAGLSDREIYEMHRDDLIELLEQSPPRFLDRRVKSRLPYLDDLTLRRLLFLCRRCERNLTRLQPARLVPPSRC